MLRRPWLMAALLVAFMGLVALLLRYNGLYGQDAHEYLRQCQVFGTRLTGGPLPAPEGGDRQFGAGFPLLAALVNVFLQQPIFSTQLVCLFSAGAAFYFFFQILGVFLPGAHVLHRWLWSVVFVAAPVFWRNGLSSMSDMPALAACLGALWIGHTAGKEKGFFLGLLSGIAFLCRPASAALLLPLWCHQCWLRRGQWIWWMGALCAGLAIGAVQVWARWPLGEWLPPTVIKDWSLVHLIHRHFSNVHGTISYSLPNLIHLLSPICHWEYSLFLPFFLFFFKKTDLLLAERRWLLGAGVAYALLIGGLPVQSIRYLLPLWAIILLLLFPAFDRAVSFGFHYLKNTTVGILVTLLSIQAIGIALALRPLVQRNQFEQKVAQHIATHCPKNAELYTMDLDISLRSYLPEISYRNVWQQTYDTLPAGAYFLYQEARWRQQWAGQHPMANLELALGKLKEVRDLGEGWKMGRVGE